MLSAIERDTIRAAVHRTLYVHFNRRPDLPFNAENVMTLIKQQGVAVNGKPSHEADIAVLVVETIEEHIALLWRNGASHTFRRVNMPCEALAWKYSVTLSA